MIYMVTVRLLDPEVNRMFIKVVWVDAVNPEEAEDKAYDETALGDCLFLGLIGTSLPM